jgi:ubiquinone/menaquinone biosynthesis C-methylase UbiE
MQPPVPDYLSRVYTWAYLNPRYLPWLDHMWVVSFILWGNAKHLIKSAVAEFSSGDHILQAACVYGTLSQHLAAQVGPMGRLEVVDVAQIQVDNVTRKLKGQPQAHAHCADLADPDSGSAPDSLDGVCCFFLLHEVPSAVRTQIVDNLLRLVRVGGKVVFTDYHQTKWWHPLRPIMAFVFWRLEPFAASLQRQDISKLSERATQFSWKKSTRFGGLYQQLVAVRQT